MASPVASGANSATFAVNGGGTLDSDSWANLPEGRLSDLLTATYTDIVDGATAEEQFFEAFSKAGGIVSVISNVAVSGGAFWSCASGASPVLSFELGAGADLGSVRIALSYSASA